VPRPAALSRPADDPHGEARAARRRAASRAGAREAVASTLRGLREEAGLSQEQLGARAGLHRTYVGGYERGERRLTIEAVGQVLSALGVSWARFGADMDARHVRTAGPRSGATGLRSGRPTREAERPAGRSQPGAVAPGVRIEPPSGS
jgi:transcriptional regulator with XRE-family HTH domain